MVMLAHVYILAAFCVAASLQQSTPFSECEDGPPPLSLKVTGCTNEPCPFYKGTNLTAQWTFTVVEDTKTLKPRVRATVLGVTVNFPFPQKDACTTLENAECPLDKDEEVTYNLVMPISRSYPNTPLAVEFAFLDDLNKVQVCFSVKGKVVNGKGDKVAPLANEIEPSIVRV